MYYEIHRLSQLGFSNSKEDSPKPVYTGNCIGEAAADVRGFIKKFRGLSGQGPFHNATVGARNASKRYVHNHTTWE